MGNQHLPRYGLQLVVTTTQGSRRELLQSLEGFREKAVAEPDNSHCEIFEDLGENNRILWTEWWPSREVIERVLESERFRAMSAAIRLLGNLERMQRVEERPTSQIARPVNVTTSAR
ncbi:MAG: hypothetical protein GY906_40085 [bacterium]|nr:hypothetical protein [bacterium]